MRNLLGKAIRWLAHEHKWEIQYRQITQYETPVKNGWKKENWTHLKWWQRCTECGAHRTEEFTSALGAPPINTLKEQ